MKQKKNWTGETCQCQRFNTSLQKDIGKKEEYRLALTSRFQVLQELLREATFELRTMEKGERGNDNNMQGST
jgi:hypothetical protein